MLGHGSSLTTPTPSLSGQGVTSAAGRAADHQEAEEASLGQQTRQTRHASGLVLWVTVASMLVALLLFIALMKTARPELVDPVDEASQAFAYLLAAGCSAWAARRQRERRQRLGWRWIEFAWLFSALAQLVYLVYPLLFHQDTPYPSLADAFFLLYYVSLAVGLCLLPSQPLRSGRRIRLWLDAGIIAASLLAVSWYYLIDPLVVQGAESAFVLAVTVGYPVGDVALVTAAMALVMQSTSLQSPRFRAAYALLAVGQLTFVYADSIWTYLTLQGTYVSGMLSVDTFWVVGALLGAAAPLYLVAGQRMPMRAVGNIEEIQGPIIAEMDPLLRSLLPYGPLVALLAVAAISELGIGESKRLDNAFVLLGIGVAALVICRQALTLRTQAAINRQLRELNVKALAAARAKSEFLATMSHELRTPMNGVIGMADLVLQTELSDEQRDYIRTLHASAYSLLAVLNDILDFSKIEAGKLDVERIPVDVREAVTHVVEILGPKAREKGLVLQTQIAPDVPGYVLGDPTRLRQILFNLVGNALKFTERGQIVVRVTAEREGETTPASATPLLRIAVEDTGIGISAAARARLFHPFTQADGSTTRKYGGTGLGLSISKQLVELMGGQIGVESVEGQGSTFWFALPSQPDIPTGDQSGGDTGVPTPWHAPTSDDRAGFTESELAGMLRAAGTVAVQAPEMLAAADARTASAMPSLPIAPRMPRVLLAEDNAVNRKLAVLQLKRLGYEADVAADGREVLDLLAKNGRAHYALVLMDCQMPEMDGYEATRAIRAQEREEHGGERLPIIAMTANALQGDRERCEEAGMDDYLSKPVQLAALEQSLRHWVVARWSQHPYESVDKLAR